MNPWRRDLWGILAGGKNSEPFLLTSIWDDVLVERNFYDGEPPRALLFTTRADARKWMAGRTIIDPAEVKKWRLRPVRVRETVSVI